MSRLRRWMSGKSSSLSLPSRLAASATSVRTCRRESPRRFWTSSDRKDLETRASIEVPMSWASPRPFLMSDMISSSLGACTSCRTVQAVMA